MIRISTHRMSPDYATQFEDALKAVMELDPGELNIEASDYHIRIGALQEWNNDLGWQGVLRRIRTKGMDPPTDYETGESREGDHKPSEGQGAGAAFIFDKANRILAYYHGIPYNSHTMLLKYLHNKTNTDVGDVEIFGIPRQGAIENFKNAKNIRVVQIPLDGEEAQIAASKLQGGLFSSLKELPYASFDATLLIKIKDKKDEEVKDSIEKGLLQDFDENSNILDGLRVSYKDAGGQNHDNVDLRSELFVEKFVNPDNSSYLLDDVLLTYLNANYQMLLNEHPILRLE